MIKPLPDEAIQKWAEYFVSQSAGFILNDGIELVAQEAQRYTMEQVAEQGLTVIEGSSSNKRIATIEMYLMELKKQAGVEK